MSFIDDIKSFFKSNKSYIKITKVFVENNQILSEFEISKDMEKFFKKNSMYIEYLNGEGFDLNNVPKSILVIPLISNLLPIIWLTDCCLIVDEVDETFYNSIPKIKEGYIHMFKKLSFNGKITANKLVNNTYEYEKEYISLFTYGVDSLNTVLKYINYKPHTLTLWGADVPIHRKENWNVVKRNVEQFTSDYNLNNFFVKSNFRNFINHALLYDCFKEELENEGNWWFTVQHGIALLSQAAILAYILKVKYILIASSCQYTKEEIENKQNIQICASSPFIDNEFKFSSCSVIHDGWELTRGEKISNIVEYAKQNNTTFNMHVCWYSPLGINCNICEKCARTYMYLMAIGEDPSNYGFNVNNEAFKQVEKSFYKTFYNKETVAGWSVHPTTIVHWKENQKILNENEDYWRTTPIGWVLDVDFDELNKSFYG